MRASLDESRPARREQWYPEMPLKSALLRMGRIDRLGIIGKTPTSGGALNRLPWDDCVDRLYDAVGREQELSRALGNFMPWFDARAVTYLTIPDVRNPTSSHLGSTGVSEASLMAYHSHFSVHDEWVRAAQQRPDMGPGSVFRGTELISRTRLRQTYFGREFLARTGVIDIVCAVVEMAHTDGPTTFLTFHRHAGQRPFSAGDSGLLKRLSPHLRNVLRLHRRLAPALALGSTLAQIVQRIDVPVFYVAADAAARGANAAAAQQQGRTGGWVQSVDGKLRLRTQGGWVSMREALQSMVSSPHGSASLDLVDEARRGATFSLRAVAPGGTDGIAVFPVVAVATLEPGSRDKARALRSTFGLTDAQARVALQLAGGKTAADVARQTGVALSTTRTHIAAALAKLGLNRQAQLAQLMVTL
jgi:DNA-binding CsgD family transcriptional regulator